MTAFPPSTPGGARPPAEALRALGVVGTLAVLAAALAPVWSSPVLPTADGPSHVYNAFVANALADEPALAAVYELGPLLRPQLLSDTFLRLSGPVLGWDVAERLLFSLIVLGGLAALAGLSRTRDPTALALLVWIPNGWFAWMGFYDFALSLLFLALLVRSLERGDRRAPHLWMAALVATHLFTAAVGCVLLGARWLVERAGRARLAGFLAWSGATAALLVAVTPGGVAPEVPAPNSVAHLLTSDAVVGHDPTAMLVGAVLFGVATVGVLDRCARVRGGVGWSALTGWIGVLFLVGSLGVPEWIGRGGYVPTRMRVVALVLLVPAGLDALRRRGLPSRAFTAAGGLVAWLVLLHQAGHVEGYAATLERAVREADAAVTALGAGPGGLALRVEDPFRQDGFRRVFAYERIPERLALARRWPVLDNYEASEPVFRVRWRGERAPLHLGTPDSTLAVRGTWTGLLYLVHDPLVEVHTDHVVAASADAPPFAVTVLRGLPAGPVVGSMPPRS